MKQIQQLPELHERVAENQAKENPGPKITISNEGQSKTPQTLYFFNTILKVSSVPKYPLYKNKYSGGAYNG